MIFIIVLAWPIFLCTCCGNCCCFSKNVKPGILGLVYYIIAVTLNAGVIIAAIVGFARSSKFTSSFDGATCSIINFIEHMMNGEEKTEFPKWIGTNNIVKTLNDLNTPIATIGAEYTGVFESSPYNGLNSKVSDYEGKLDAIGTTSKDDFYKGVSYSGSTVYPLFTEAFHTKESKYYKMLLDEYSNVITVHYENVKGLDEAGKQIKDSTTLGSTLDGYTETFSNIEQTISNVGDPAIENILKVRDKAFDLFLLAFKILYGVFLALAAALIILLSLYVWLKFSFLKIPTHIVWNVGMLICFLTLLIGSLLGIVSYIFNAISPVMTYLLSKEYLSDPSSLFSQTGDVADYIDICLNKDGDLSTALGVSSGPAADLEKFDTYSKAIEAGSSTIPTSCSAYASILEELDAIEADITKATDSSYGNNDISTVIESINSYTDGTCGTKDYYAVSENKCKSGYIKDASSGPTCYVFPINSPKDYSSGCSSEATSLQNKIKYVSDVYNLISPLKTKLKDSDHKVACDGVLADIKTVYTKSKTMTDAMTSVSSGAVGSDSKLFSMFNCNFLPHDLIQFINQFHNKFVPACKDVGISAVVGSIFSYVAVYFLLRALYHFAPADAKKTETAPKPKVEVTRIESEMMKIKA